MWRYNGFVVVILITQVKSNEFLIWQNALFGCLESHGHHSIVETYQNLMQCPIVHYGNDYKIFKHFPRTPCGNIHSNKENTYMQWWITQRKRTVLKWTVIKFLVFKNDVACSLSHVAWMTEHKQSYHCGYYHLPWKKFTKGNVRIIQRFILTTKRPSSFKLFFNIEFKKIPQVDVNKLVQISPRLTDFVHSDDLMLFLVGSFPFQALDITIASMKGNVMLDLTVYDGPSKLTPTLNDYNRHGNNYTHETRTTSSFQALLVVSKKITAEQKASVSWFSRVIGKVESKCSFGPFYTNNYCVKPSARNGLVFMEIHTNDYYLSIQQYSFNENMNDAYSNAINVFCQYGGMWIYSSSNKAFTRPTLMMEQCTNEVFSDVLYSEFQYFAVIVLQYRGISEISLNYFVIQKSEHQVAPNIFVSPSYAHQTIVVEKKFHILQIFTSVEKLNNISLHLAESSQPNGIMAVNINYKHFTSQKQCACKAIIWHAPYVHDEQTWCNPKSEANHMQRKILSSVAKGSTFAYKATGIMKPKDIHLDCKDCFLSGYILFQLKQLILPDFTEILNQTKVTHAFPGYSFKYSTLKNKKVKLWIHMKSAENFEVRMFPKNKNASLMNSSVVFSGCVNGIKFEAQTTMQSGSSLHHLSQGCVKACLITVTANAKHQIDQSLDLVIQLLPLQNHTSDNVKFYIIGLNKGFIR